MQIATNTFYILLIGLYFFGPLLLLRFRSARATFWLTYISLGFQTLVGAAWFLSLFIELAFASEGARFGGWDYRTILLFIWLYAVAALSVVLPLRLAYLIHQGKTPFQLSRWRLLMVSAFLPVILALPLHPIPSLLTSIGYDVKNSVDATEYRDNQNNELKLRAETLRKDFESGKKEIACEWFANDPAAPPEKFAACRELIESIQQPDERMKQINLFRPTDSEFAVWFADQRNFSPELRDWSSATSVVPQSEHGWLMRQMLQTLSEASEPVFTEEYVGIRMALNDALEGHSRAQWSADIQTEFAKFPKEALINRAEKLAKEQPTEVDQVNLFVKTLKGEKIFTAE